MTKEQEAIEYLKQFSELMKKWEATEIFSNIETVLNMLKEKDKQIAKYEKIYKEYDCYRWVKELEKKDKIIDLMVKEINETVRGYIDYCQFKMVCDRNCKKCIKQYFERKASE